MKKRIVFTLAILMAFAGSAWADGWQSGLEVGGGARFELALGDMKEHESGNFDFNVNAAWPLPLGLSDDGLLAAVGLTAETGVLFLLVKAGAGYTILPEKDNVYHYMGLNLGAGYRFD